MIGVIIVTHGDMAKGMKNAAEMIVGEKEFLFAIGYHVGESLKDLENRICRSIDRNKKYDKWIIFSDMFGGTPSNVSSVVITQKNGVLITDVNLSMVLQALTNAGKSDFKTCIKSVMESGENCPRMITKEAIMKSSVNNE